MRRLIAKADVVVANYSPGALKHFGLDYDTLRAIKDDIILTSASAYGSEGPLARANRLSTAWARRSAARSG